MRRSLAISILTTACAALPAIADEPAALRFEGTRWVGPTADWTQVFAWAAAQEQLLSASKRSLGEAEGAKIEAAVRDAAVPMGRAFAWSTVLDTRRMRHTHGDSEYRLRTDGEGLFAQVQHAEKAAWVVALGFKREIDARLAPPAPIAVAKAGGEATRKIFGLECVGYDLTGNGTGRVWIHVPAADRVERLKAFAANATRAMGRLDSEIFLAAIVQAGGVPVLSLTEGVKGPSFAGNSLGGKVVVACWAIEDGTLGEDQTAVPDGYALQHIPPR